VGQGVSAEYEPFVHYVMALELFDKQKYGAAQTAFGRYLERGTGENLIEARAMYAICSYHLLRDEAGALLKDFVFHHPNHPRAPECRFYAGKLPYLQRRYPQAIEALAAVDEKELKYEHYREARFMLGYSYFMTGKNAEAKAIFADMTRKTGAFFDDAAYYLGLLSFRDGDYAACLEALRQVETSENYRLKVPVYIASSLMRLGRFEELENYGAALLAAGEPCEQKAALMREIGVALYERQKYAACIEYLETYVKESKSPDRGILFRLGVAAYRIQEREGAKFYLEKVASGVDTLAQAASYYMGKNYDEWDMPEEARNAFKHAAETPLKDEYAAEALLQYVKISLELNYFDDAVRGGKKFVLRYKTHPQAPKVSGIVGEALLYSAKYREAMEHFEKAPKSDKRAQAAYQKAAFLYAMELFKEGKDPQEVVGRLNLAIEINAVASVTLDAYFWKGELFFNLKQYKDAKNAYEAFVQHGSGKTHAYYPHALMGLGWAHLRLNQYAPAAQCFADLSAWPKLSETRPELYSEACLRAGDAFFAQKAYAKAAGYYQKAKNFGKTGVDYALYQLGMCAQRQSERYESIKLHKQLVAEFPKSELRDDALFQIAAVYLRWLNDYPNAKKFAKQLIDEHPYSEMVPGAYNTMALAALAGGDSDEAVKYFKVTVYTYGGYSEYAQVAIDELSSLLPPDELATLQEDYHAKHPHTSVKFEALAFNAGRDLLLMENRPHEAIEKLNEYLEKFPHGKYYHEAMILRGEAAMAVKAYSAALKDFEIAAQINGAPDLVVRALKNTADVHFLQRDYPRALEKYLAAAKKAAGTPDETELQYEIGKVYLANEQYEKARELFKKLAATKDATDYLIRLAHCRLGYAQYKLGARDSAMARLAKAEDNATDVVGAEAKYYMTRILFEEGKYAEAKKSALEMKDHYPNHNYRKAQTFLVLAQAYYAMGEKFQAVETVKSILENIPEEDVKAEAEKLLRAFEDGSYVPPTVVAGANVKDDAKKSKKNRSEATDAEISKPEPEAAQSPTSIPESPKTASSAVKSSSPSVKNETASAKVEPVVKPSSPPIKSETSSAKTESKTYHLIAESASTKENAERAVKTWAQKGLVAKVLPNPATGGYRISVFSAKDRATVEAQKKSMIESGKLNAGAWIFTE
jgi:tetratricopeptide (TPR) repeat protein